MPDAADYFPAATPECPTFAGDSGWRPLVDGAAYFAELDELLGRLGPGDGVLIAGFEFDGRIDLRGLERGASGYSPLGYRLARLAADSVDVRIVLAGEPVAAVLPVPALAGFRHNARAVRKLRRFVPAGARQAPLRGRVFLDRSGPFLGSNHLKSVAIVHRGVVTAFVGGIDLTANRRDRGPHDLMRQRGRRWGWHDAAVRLSGPAAARAHAVLADRWRAAAGAHGRWRLGRGALERSDIIGPTSQPAVAAPGDAVRVLRSIARRRPRLGARRVQRVHEVFDTLSTAIDAAQHYVYIEDQYLQEQAGGKAEFELYPYLLRAAARGVKIMLVGSGVRDTADPGIHLRPINRTINSDVQRKLIDRLDAAHRGNVVLYRVRRVTVHAKIVLIDDVFACIGSANMFSRSMSGTDRELSAAFTTTTDRVRDLRVQLWAEHLRTPTSPALADLDLALAAWNPEWGPDATLWTEAGRPPGFEPAERALFRVPERRRWSRVPEPDPVPQGVPQEA